MIMANLSLPSIRPPMLFLVTRDEPVRHTISQREGLFEGEALCEGLVEGAMEGLSEGLVEGEAL